MRFIHHSITDPYFNLAAEQYMLEHGFGNAFLLWRNGPSVIIGKNQNAYAQLNLPYVEQNHIQVARRLTGGGAVFHDLGNVNFTFITDAPAQREIDFSRFTEPIVASLAAFGVQASLSGRNDLMAAGCKISGNAQCVYPTADGRARLLHHGTLLFSADLSRLAGALRVNREKMESKGIESVRSRVANIRDLPGYRGPATAEGFFDALAAAAEREYGAPENYTPSEVAAIRALSETKFSTWEWNFGASKEYRVTRERRFPYGSVTVSLDAHGGVLRQIAFFGDYFGTRDTAELSSRLVGCRMETAALRAALAECEKYIYGSSPEELTALILGD